MLPSLSTMVREQHPTVKVLFSGQPTGAAAPALLLILCMHLQPGGPVKRHVAELTWSAARQTIDHSQNREEHLRKPRPLPKAPTARQTRQRPHR